MDDLWERRHHRPYNLNIWLDMRRYISREHLARFQSNIYRAFVRFEAWRGDRWSTRLLRKLGKDLLLLHGELVVGDRLQHLKL